MSQLSLIERDIVRERLRDLYEQAFQDNPLSQKPQKTNEVTLEVDQPESISSVLVDEFIQQSQTDPAEIESEQLIYKKPEQEEGGQEPRESPQEPDLFSAPKSDPIEEPPLVIDKIAETVPEESVADKIKKQKKVESLKDAIGINEKFFLINELFDGNLTDYNETIGELDALDHPDDALKHLADLAESKDWNGNHEAVKQLQEFVERKFM